MLRSVSVNCDKSSTAVDWGKGWCCSQEGGGLNMCLFALDYSPAGIEILAAQERAGHASPGQTAVSHHHNLWFHEWMSGCQKPRRVVVCRCIMWGLVVQLLICSFISLHVWFLYLYKRTIKKVQSLYNTWSFLLLCSMDDHAGQRCKKCTNK